MRNKAYYVVIRFGYENIIMDTLYYEEEIKLQKEKIKKEFSDKELKTAIDLIEAMSDEFKPEEYIDEYQTRLRKAIDKKINVPNWKRHLSFDTFIIIQNVMFFNLIYNFSLKMLRLMDLNLLNV